MTCVTDGFMKNVNHILLKIERNGSLDTKFMIRLLQISYLMIFCKKIFVEPCTKNIQIHAMLALVCSKWCKVIDNDGFRTTVNKFINS